MTLKIGDKAPSFTLKNQDDQDVSLSSFAGQKVVVYFYPAAATPGCTTQACEIRDNINSLKSAGYTVLGVSPDQPAKLRKFKDKESLNFDLLSDPDNAIQQAYGAYGEKSMYGKTYMGIERTTVLIDGTGKVARVWNKVSVKGHADEVLAAAQAL